MTKQVDPLAYIKWYCDEFGYAPSMDDISKALGLTKPTVQYRLRKLRAEGKLAYEDKVARSYRVL